MHPLRQRVLLCLQAGDTFAITVPVVTETLFGIGLLPRGSQNLAEWARLRPNLTCYIPDEPDAETAAALQRTLRRQGWQLETVDAFIAVVAIRYDLVLLTSDNDFAPVPNLKRDNWLVP
jgi:predicted nucleic acid-binding protein